MRGIEIAELGPDQAREIADALAHHRPGRAALQVEALGQDAGQPEPEPGAVAHGGGEQRQIVLDLEVPGEKRRRDGGGGAPNHAGEGRLPQARRPVLHQEGVQGAGREARLDDREVREREVVEAPLGGLHGGRAQADAENLGAERHPARVLGRQAERTAEAPASERAPEPDGPEVAGVAEGDVLLEREQERRRSAEHQADAAGEEWRELRPRQIGGDQHHRGAEAGAFGHQRDAAVRIPGGVTIGREVVERVAGGAADVERVVAREALERRLHVGQREAAERTHRPGAVLLREALGVGQRDQGRAHRVDRMRGQDVDRLPRQPGLRDRRLRHRLRDPRVLPSLERLQDRAVVLRVGGRGEEREHRGQREIRRLGGQHIEDAIVVRPPLERRDQRLHDVGTAVVRDARERERTDRLRVVPDRPQEPGSDQGFGTGLQRREDRGVTQALVERVEEDAGDLGRVARVERRHHAGTAGRIRRGVLQGFHQRQEHLVGGAPVEELAGQVGLRRSSRDQEAHQDRGGPRALQPCGQSDRVGLDRRRDLGRPTEELARDRIGRRAGELLDDRVAEAGVALLRQGRHQELGRRGVPGAPHAVDGGATDRRIGVAERRRQDGRHLVGARSGGAGGAREPRRRRPPDQRILLCERADQERYALLGVRPRRQDLRGGAVVAPLRRQQRAGREQDRVGGDAKANLGRRDDLVERRGGPGRARLSRGHREIGVESRLRLAIERRAQRLLRDLAPNRMGLRVLRLLHEPAPHFRERVTSERTQRAGGRGVALVARGGGERGDQLGQIARRLRHSEIAERIGGGGSLARTAVKEQRPERIEEDGVPGASGPPRRCDPDLQIGGCEVRQGAEERRVGRRALAGDRGRGKHEGGRQEDRSRARAASRPIVCAHDPPRSPGRERLAPGVPSQVSARTRVLTSPCRVGLVGRRRGDVAESG